ncbi:MAG: hypothetical protein ACXAC7_22910, partial [Candidatus Hodarchaeales archaeon]
MVKKTKIKPKISYLKLFMLLIGLILTFSISLVQGVYISNIEGSIIENKQNNEPPIEIPGNGTPMRVQAGNTFRIRTQSQFQLNATFAEDVEIKINESDDNPVGPLPENTYQYCKFWKIHLNKSDVSMNATLGMPFDPDNLPWDISPSGLRFAFYNGSSNQW